MSKKKILQDHKQRRKTFIPPFTHMLGPLNEVSWVNTMLPEFLWIALIQDYYGYHQGVEIITEMTRIVRKCSLTDKKRVFATISSFGELKTDEQSCLQRDIETSDILLKIQKALLPLIVFYPDCPLRLFYSTKPSLNDVDDEPLDRFKGLFEGLYDKTSQDAMMVQATAIWLAFDSGVLKVKEGLALASFPEIEKYPHTELSQKVAASIRSTIFFLFTESQYPASSTWPHYFWNRGLEIDGCYFEETPDE